MGGLDFKTVLTLVCVLALVFYLAWLTTRIVAGKSRMGAQGRFMRVVDRLGVDRDKALLLVRIGSEYCVISMTGHEMRLIKTLDAEEAEAFEQLQPKTSELWPTGGITGTLMRAAKGFGSRFTAAARGEAPRTQEPPSPPAQDDQSVIDLLDERIKLRKDSKWRH